MNKATIIKVDGTKQELDHRPSLKEAQGIVGGYIELVKASQVKDDDPIPGSLVTLVVDEEGKVKNKAINKTITERYGRYIYGGYVVGDVIVLEGWRTVGD